MKKKIFNGMSISDIRKLTRNTLDGEGKMAELKAALDKLFDEMESAEVEYTVEDFKAEIKKMIDEAASEKSEEQKQEVAEAIAKRFQQLQNSFKPESKELPAKVKNAVCAAVLKAKGREFVEDDVNAVLKANGISGLSFNEVIDYTIQEQWGDFNPIFSKLKKVPFTKFFYNTDTLATAAILAKQWDKSSESEKAIQSLSVTGKTISTQYVYKRQQIAREDLDDIEKDASNVLTWMNEELDRQIVNTIVMAILIGDSVNSSANQVDTFETIKKASSDVFTTVATAASNTGATFAEHRAAADAVKNPNGLPLIALMDKTELTKLSKFKYASGGDDIYRAKEEVAGQLGVDEIIVCDLLGSSSGVHAIYMLPDEYWVHEKNAISVTYPTYEKNVVNYQKERNIGGKIHGLYSTSVLKRHA